MNAGTNSDEKVHHWREELHRDQLCDMCVEVIENRCSMEAIPSHLRIKVAKVVKIVKSAFPVINADSYGHIRMVNSLLFKKTNDRGKKGMYTQVELKNALLRGLTYKSSMKQLKDDFGVAKSTFCRHRCSIVFALGLQALPEKELKVYLKNPVNNNAIEQAVLQLHVDKPGPKPLLVQVEKDLLALKFELRDRAGSGLTTRDVQLTLQDHAHHKRCFCESLLLTI